MIDGDDLKAMRLNAGISQQGMSKKLECDRRTIHNYELGVSDIPSARLFQWFKYCKLDISVLLNQIKAVRGEASKNGTAKLLDVISVMLIFGSLWSYLIVTPLYLALLLVCISYSTYKKDINGTHISTFIFILTALNHALFQSGIVKYIAENNNLITIGSLYFGIQLILTLIMVLILIFRVQLSRTISNSKDIKLTHFDGVFHWIYLYLSTVYLLAILENIARSHFELQSWTIVYDNFEGLIYIGWALCCGTLLTMTIISTKSKINDEKAAFE